MRAAIVGIGGLQLTAAERGMLAAYRPAGVILFARNVGSPGQLGALTAALRAVLPERAVLMVDQEGGRVARLRPPHWRAHPAAAAIGALYARSAEAGLRAAWLTGALIGGECRAAGFDVVTAPVLDLRVAGAHDVIGDRAFAAAPEAVAALGGAVAEGLRAAGIQPVGKHIPGHGRATADSHAELPRLAAPSAEDIAPFAAQRGIGWAMTAHILYRDIDPVRPATLSSRVIGTVIRGRCGFGGVLISDDLAMGALAGHPATLAEQAIEAGCDLVLHCTGVAEQTQALLEQCPDASAACLERMAAAAAAAAGGVLDCGALAAERDALMLP